MALYKLAHSAGVRGISQHRTLENAKRAKFELVEGGMYGYKIYVWNKEANKWSKWE